MNELFQATNCEDCDAPFRLQDSSDAIDMDVDMIDYTEVGEAGSRACTSCGKQVCRSCAVSNLGMERKCLNCAGRANARGGTRWMDQD